MTDLKNEGRGKLIAEIDGREVPLLDYGMVRFQMNHYMGQDIYDLHGNFIYNAHAFLTTKEKTHGYFELTEQDNVRDVTGQLVTGFFQTPEYSSMSSSYQSSKAGYLKLQSDDKTLSTDIINGRLTGLKSASQRYVLVTNDDFSMDPQTGEILKNLKELSEDEVQKLNVTYSKVNSGVEFTVDGKIYSTSGRINPWKNSTINPLKTKLAIMSIGDGKNIHGFDLFYSNTNYIEVVEKTETIKVPFETIYEEDPNLDNGKTTIVTPGKDGEKDVTGKLITPPTNQVVKVGTKPTVVESDVPFKTITKENPNLPIGTEKVITEGVVGKTITTTTYKVDPKTGKVTPTTKEEIVESKDKIIELGTGANVVIPFETIYEEDPNLDNGKTTIVTPGKDGEKDVTGKVITPPTSQVVKIGVKPTVVESDVPFETITRENPNLPKGEEKIIQEGQNGKKIITTTYKVDPKTGKVTPTTKEEIVESKDKIIELGTGANVVIPFETIYEDDPTLPTGQEREVTPGINGEKDVTGKIIKKPQTRVVKRGTKATTAPMPKTGEASSILSIAGSGLLTALSGSLFLASRKRKREE